MIDLEPGYRLSPEQSKRFIELAIGQSKLLEHVRIVDLRPWYRRPKVLVALAACATLVIAIAATVWR